MAVKRLDHVELYVACLELPAQPLDVTVHGPFIHIDLIVIGCIHQGVAAFHHPWPNRQRLQDKKFGDRERYRFVFPGAGMPVRVDTQFSAFQDFAIRFHRRGALLWRGPAQLDLDALDQKPTREGFADESAPRPFHYGIRRRGGAISTAALPSDER
jgi:hypothetical protein